MTRRQELSDMDTYVFIDASNIRYACWQSCGIRIDFKKLLKYLKEKYTNLKSANYFEGIASDDKERKKLFESYKRIGYKVFTLSRKKYVSPAIYRKIICKKCKATVRIRVSSKRETVKSNVDVYLATELLNVVADAKKATHIILMSCDGDYAEMIRSVTQRNSHVYVTVLATPFTKKNNYLSIRLKQLRRELSNRYLLRSIVEIKDKVS